MNMEKTYMRPVIDQIATGCKIRQIRKSLGFSVRDIQNVFGFDFPQAVYAWEQGKNVPTVDNLLVLSALFNVDLKDLLVIRMVENLLKSGADCKKSA